MGDEQAVFAGRRAQLQLRLKEAGLAGCLLTSKANRFYFSGFAPETGGLSRTVALAVPAEGAAVYLVSDLDRERALAAGVSFAVPLAYGEGPARLKMVLSAFADGPIGIEAAVLPYAVALELQRVTGRRLVACDELPGAMRMIKSADEIEALRAASRVTDAAAAAARDALQTGVTELELAGSVMEALYRHGADGTPEGPFVLIGERAMMPHLRPSTKQLEGGETVVFDFGAVLAGYETDICRTYALRPASDLAQELHAVVLAALEAARRAARVGTRAGDVHDAAHAVIADAGFGKYFNHAVGHGVGVQSHEAPLCRAGAAERLQAGMVLALEPAIYYGGVAVRVEDDFVVGADGAVSLNSVTKDLEV